MANGNGARLDALVGYALAQYAEAGDPAVLVVEKKPGRRSVIRGRSAGITETSRLVRSLEARTSFLKRWGALVWSDFPSASGTRHPVRYIYCTNPDHREGLLLAQAYGEAGPEGDPEPMDRQDLPPGWWPQPLSTERSPAERFRAMGLAWGFVFALMAGLFLANILIWALDGIGGTSVVGAAVVHHEFEPKRYGSDWEVGLVTAGGGRVELDGGDLRPVYDVTALGDLVLVYSSGFTGRTVAVQTPHAYHDLTGGWGEQVAFLLLSLAIIWLAKKILTWPKLRWGLVLGTPIGVVLGVWWALNGMT